MMKYSEVRFPLGRGSVTARIPNLMAVVEPKPVRGVGDDRKEVRRALAEPIGSPRLREIARGKRSAAIVVNDITRPYPGGLFVEELARELNEAGLRDDEIFLVVAYGTHRINTDEELTGMFGERVVKRFRFVHHVGSDAGTLVNIGVTPRGVSVDVNREFMAADVKILTGLIAPHHAAGFSGGRKSLLPGISGLQTLKTHHSFPFRPRIPSMGWLDGNAFHEEALAAAKLARVDFILNSVDNANRELVAAVAGDLEAAHRAGVEICRPIWTFELPSKADVVIVSPGGFPRDIDLYQSQKACSCAELACRDGGEIVLCSEASDGAGKFARLLQEASHPQEVIDKYVREGFTAESTAKAYMYARALIRFRVGIACSTLRSEDVEKMFMSHYNTIEDAIESALKRCGEGASFLAIPSASEMIITEKSGS
ncbi:MAG: nickel-dependent lactate racemase [Synergistaceae bacterium]|jgi:nickel-dependent lactate racemase|nr:nickel-dependent lactate racemase [Synergistaceae bacterium]